jgi:exopolyphosphatase/guanosine-5'-triphosphate,3'-diphosphate pyrophosphatase
MSERIAVVDIGTNTLLLLIAEAEGGELTRVYEDCQFGRLGKGLDGSGNLSPESIQASLSIARYYRSKMDELHVARVAVVGTQALREAGNRDLFVGPAEKLFGSEIQVIPGEREAELVALSVARSMPELADQTFVIADVGGGSTEIIVSEGGEVTWWDSLPIGSVRFKERHLADDPPTADQSSAMIRDIDAALDPIELPTGVPLVGTAGTATSIASVHLRLAKFDPDRLQTVEIPPAEVERQLARHLELDTSGRRQLPGMEPERADVIPAGVAIFARLLHKLEAPVFIASDRGVRWGLAYELAAG